MNIFRNILYLLLIQLSHGRIYGQGPESPTSDKTSDFQKYEVNSFSPSIHIKLNLNYPPANSEPVRKSPISIFSHVTYKFNIFFPILNQRISPHPQESTNCKYHSKSDSSRHKSYDRDSHPPDSHPPDLHHSDVVSSTTEASSTIPPSTVSPDFDPSTHPNWRLINDEKCGTNTENRIIGGKNASLGQYPWIARIGYSIDGSDQNVVFKCGGALINQYHVITAAHCVINLPENFQLAQVRLGEYDASKDNDCMNEVCAPPHQDFDVQYVLVHKDYGEPKNANDISVVKLSDAVKYSDWVLPICLPFGTLLHKDLEGTKVDIAGWGYYDVTIPEGSDVLQTVKLPVLPMKSCIQKFRRYVINKNNQICVGGDVGKDSCSGDSGGPLMKVEAEGSDGPKFYLFGIVSFGATYCGMTTSPAIYTKVTSYAKWILDNLSAES